MAFTPAPNVARIEMIYNLNGEIVENVYHVSKNSPYDAGTLEGLGAMMQSWENDYAAAERSNACTLVSIRCTALDAQSSPQIVQTLTTPIAGQRNSPAAPGSVTYAVKLQTARGPRGSQGRTFWVGLAEDQIVGNYMVETQAIAIRNDVVAIMTLLNDTPGRGVLSVLHSQRNGAPLNPRVATPVSAIVITNYNLDRQGSRLPGKHRKKRHTSTP